MCIAIMNQYQITKIKIQSSTDPKPCKGGATLWHTRNCLGRISTKIEQIIMFGH